MAADGDRRAHPFVATYRVQLHAGFGFDDAAALVPTLATLGISHLYCSPVLQAVPGSTHGYDVVDHARVSLDLGGEEGRLRLVEALAAQGMGMVLDIVPNHMAVGAEANRWWWDVLENGPSSVVADHFDVDWDPPESKLRDQVLVPVLGDHYGRVLEAGELRVAREGARFAVEYFDHRFPVSPRSLDEAIGTAARRVGSRSLAFIADLMGGLPLASARDRSSVMRRRRDQDVIAQLLERELAEDPAAAEALDAVLAEINDDPVPLHALLERQNYRLAFWRTATHELDYRRFFDVTTLAGIRVELPHVFDAVHELVIRWAQDGTLDGIRIDHPDGLRDPQGYLERLARAAPDAWIVVEKILEAGESLPETWPVAGTTGYDFLNDVVRLYVDASATDAMTEIYTRFTGDDRPFEAVVLEAKRDNLRRVLAADVNRLAGQFARVCEERLRYRDYAREELRRGLVAVLLGFDVYRTYVRVGTDGSAEVTAFDERHVRNAAGAAKVFDESIDPELVDFLADVLLLRVPGPEAEELALRFQQVTGPAMAKGVEDTAFYRYCRLVALNEVGGDPGRFGSSPAEFHGANLDAAAHWPERMLASSTHDTKRSEDVRVRIALLAERPADWAESVMRWRARHEHLRTADAPDRVTEYLLYQTLVGAHPLSEERALEYLTKAAREAKLRTSWLDPDAAYEEALGRFVRGVLADPATRAELDQWAGELDVPARVTSLAQLVLKLTSPGVPDLYQGSEYWTDSLVDPDNRRPLPPDPDPLPRSDHLFGEGVCGESSQESAIAADTRGLTKRWVLERTLALRRRRPSAFAGTYRPLAPIGAAAEHVVAYERGDEVVVAVPRLVIARSDRGGWGDTRLDLPEGTWTNVFTGEEARGPVMIGAAARRVPVMVWERTGS